MKRSLVLLAVAAVIFYSAPSYATTGIESVGYLWFLVLFFVGCVAVLVVIGKLLMAIRSDSAKHRDIEQEK